MDGRCPALVTKDQDPLTSGLQRKKLGPLLAGSGHERPRLGARVLTRLA